MDVTNEPTARDAEAIFSEHRDRYIEILKPLFLPADPVSNDIIKYFASLLRVLGLEDKGWDPYAESRAVLNDLNYLMQIDLPEQKFPDQELTRWRLGLLLYSHIVEMDAPYEVLTNLLRFRLGKGYSPNPFYTFLTPKEQKNFKKFGIKTWRKIEIISQLSKEAGHAVGGVFDEFYNGRLRNAVQHSDTIFADDDFRSRNGISGDAAFTISYEQLDELITKAKAFIAAYFYCDAAARTAWGGQKNKAIPYDPNYKGLIEVLVDDKDMMCGFKVHWPNNSESFYRRTADGVDMCNCMLALKDATIDLFVGRYAVKPGRFSPLVEHDEQPVYTPLEISGVVPIWPSV